MDGERLPGCDWRTFGGLVAAPPSWSVKHGRRYVWATGHEHRDPPACPDWLAAIARRDDKLPVSVGRVAPIDVDLLGGDATPYAAKVIEGGCQEVAAAVQGMRNATLNGVAYRVGRFVAGGELSKTYAITCLVQAAQASGLDAKYSEGVIAYAFAEAKHTPARTPEAKASMRSPIGRAS